MWGPVSVYCPECPRTFNGWWWSDLVERVRRHWWEDCPSRTRFYGFTSAPTQGGGAMGTRQSITITPNDAGYEVTGPGKTPHLHVFASTALPQGWVVFEGSAAHDTQRNPIRRYVTEAEALLDAVYIASGADSLP